MSSIGLPDRFRSAFNVTELSTFRLLLGVGCVCAALWAVIAATVGA